MSEAKLPTSLLAARSRATAAGLSVAVRRGEVTREVTVREPLFAEDGTPELTPTGRQRTRQIKTAQSVRIVMLIAYGHGQGQTGSWIGNAFDEGWTWPLDRSDMPRRIGARALGTVVDLDALRAAALAVARAKIDAEDAARAARWVGRGRRT